MNTFARTLSLATLVLLSACGGGGGNSLPNTVVNSPSGSSISNTGTNEFSIEASLDIDGSRLYSSGISSARLSGPVYSDEAFDPVEVRSIPVSFESQVASLEPDAAFLTFDSSGPDRLFVVFHNSGTSALCDIYMDLSYITVLGKTDPRFESIRHGSLGSSRGGGTISADGTISRVVDSGCIAPNESVFLVDEANLTLENDDEDVVSIEITDLKARAGDLVEGLSFLPLSYTVDEAGCCIWFTIEVQNNGTIPFSLSDVEVVALNQIGQPVKVTGAASPRREDEGPEVIQPGGIALFRGELGDAGNVSTMRVIVRESGVAWLDGPLP